MKALPVTPASITDTTLSDHPPRTEEMTLSFAVIGDFEIFEPWRGVRVPIRAADDRGIAAARHQGQVGGGAHDGGGGRRALTRACQECCVNGVV